MMERDSDSHLNQCESGSQYFTIGMAKREEEQICPKSLALTQRKADALKINAFMI
jgi:hypothetical protein